MKTNTITQTAPRSLTENHNGIAETLPASHPGQVYRRILVGTDFSLASEPAFEHALSLAKQNRAELLIAHADVLPGTLGFMPPECYDKWVIDSRSLAEKQIGVLVEKARKTGVHCHALVLMGFADDAIVGVAKKLKVDLIVTGSHGHRGVSRFFVGSVASRIMSRAQCSVLTVRSPAVKSRLN